MRNTKERGAVRWRHLPAGLLLLAIPVSLRADDFLRWPLPETGGIVHTLGSPQAFGGIVQFGLHPGLDIIAEEGTEVYAPLETDAAQFILMEDYTLHLINRKRKLTVIINHMDRNRLPNFLKGLSEKKLHPIRLERGALIGTVDGGYEGYRNHIHVEVRSHLDSNLHDPSAFFRETAQKDQTPPVVRAIYFLCEGVLHLEPTGIRHCPGEVEIIADVYDIYTNGLKTKVAREFSDGKLDIRMVDLTFHPQRTEFRVNGKTVRVVDFRQMIGSCSGAPPACHLTELLTPADDLFYSNENDLDHSTLSAAMFVPSDADDVDEEELTHPVFHRRYLLRSGPLPQGTLRQALVQIVVTAFDPSGLQGRKTLTLE